MNLRLFGYLYGLLYPPRCSTRDDALLQALNDNTVARRDVVEKAENVSRALSNIGAASKGIFA